MEGRYINIKKEGGQDRSLGDFKSQTLKPALLAITSGEGETSMSHKLQDHSNHVLIWQKSWQLAGKAMMPYSVKSYCQVNKHSTDFFLASKESLIFCVSKTVWSIVDLPCQNPACSLGSCGLIIGSTRVWISFSRNL